MAERLAAVGAARGALGRRLRRRPLAIAGLVLLATLYGAALFAPFLAPYSETVRDDAHYFAPPQPPRWVDAAGRWHAAPFVYPLRLEDPHTFRWVEDRTRPLALHWFVRGVPYRLFGLVPADRHLFGLANGERVFLLGADDSGRDELSRLLFGSQVSLTVGLVGIAISFTLGMIIGGVSGYWGGALDAGLMRATELVLSVPGLYLIIALRQVFPLELPSRTTYLAIVAILAFIGWASLARVVRGLVLSIRAQEYVLAAEALGLSRLRVLLRHVLPNTLSYVVVAATLAVPGYILGEVVLSFLGVGVQPPAASWGNMLGAARAASTLRHYPWLLAAPGAAIFVTVMAFNFFGDGLRDALDPRQRTGGRA